MTALQAFTKHWNASRKKQGLPRIKLHDWQRAAFDTFHGIVGVYGADEQCAGRTTFLTALLEFYRENASWTLLD
jgi:hypothetical protein